MKSAALIEILLDLVVMVIYPFVIWWQGLGDIVEQIKTFID